MVRCDIHVLGSRSGYTTLEASAGVSGSERSELEQLHFGEVGTREAAARLRSDPAMAGFPLQSGRFAISRMLPSEALDDAGRPTVEVVTLVLDSAGYARIAGALPQLASDIAYWDRARAEVSQGIELPEAIGAGSPQDAALQSLLDLWLAVRTSRGSVVGVLPASDSSRLLALVGVLDPVDRRALRWGVGMRGVSNRVDLCALSPEGSPHGARSVLRPAVRPGWHKPREMEHVGVRATSGCATFAPVTEIASMAAAPEKAAPAVGEADAATRTYAPPSRRRGRLTA